MDDLELLKAYADRRDQEAFAQLVRRHSPWLYAAARRQLGDGHLAEDATQAVFLLLSRRASSLRRYKYLSGWLFLALSYCIRDIKEQRSRRERREQEAATMRPETIEREASWDDIAPVLEIAVSRLGRQDRDAVLLRFYERRPLAEVGVLLGISEEAARKRVDRAVDRLREYLAAKGAKAQSLSLAALILAHATESGPAGLVTRVVASVSEGSGAGTAGGVAQGAGRMMVLAKAKVAVGVIAGAAITVGSAGAVAIGRGEPPVQGGTQITPAAQPTTERSVAADVAGMPQSLPNSLEGLLAACEDNMAKVHSISAKAVVVTAEPGLRCRDRDGKLVATRTAQIAFWRSGALLRLDESWDKMCSDGKVMYRAAPMDDPGRKIPEKDKTSQYTVRTLRLADAVYRYDLELKSGQILAPDYAMPLGTAANWLVRGPYWHTTPLRELVTQAIAGGATAKVEEHEDKKFDLVLVRTVKTPEGESVGTSRATFDGKKGYTIQAIESSTNANKFAQRTTYSYKQVGDVWFVVGGEHVTVGADGKDMYRTKLSVDENSLKINEPIDPAVFTVADLRIAKGAAISNSITGQSYFYKDASLSARIEAAKVRDRSVSPESVSPDAATTSDAQAEVRADGARVVSAQPQAEHSLLFWSTVASVVALIVSAGAAVIYARRPRESR